MIDVEKILKENMERIKTEYKFENVEDDDSILYFCSYQYLCHFYYFF